MNTSMLLSDRQIELPDQQLKDIWFTTIYIELQPDMQYIYDHYHIIFEHALYTMADENDKKQCLLKDKGGMIINTRI